MAKKESITVLSYNFVLVSVYITSSYVVTGFFIFQALKPSLACLVQAEAGERNSNRAAKNTELPIDISSIFFSS